MSFNVNTVKDTVERIDSITQKLLDQKLISENSKTKLQIMMLDIILPKSINLADENVT